MENTRHGLSGNALKIIAMVAMLIDHIGFYLFPEVMVLRVIGRLAFPIFAYMIAEGWRYTHHRLRYFLTVLGVGLLCQVAITVAEGDFYMNILITFALAIAACYLSEILLHGTALSLRILSAAALALIAFSVFVLPRIVSALDFDYGTVGVLLPPLLYHIRGQRWKLLATALALSAFAIGAHPVKWFALLAIPLLALYNGRRGRAKFKYLFYVFYPAHLGILWLISEFCLP